MEYARSTPVALAEKGGSFWEHANHPYRSSMTFPDASTFENMKVCPINAVALAEKDGGYWEHATHPNRSSMMSPDVSMSENMEYALLTLLL